MKKEMVALTLACCFLVCATKGQSLNQQQFISHLDSLTKKLMERIPEIPAITITLVNENGPIFIKAYGWANKEAGIKADVNTEFYIASSTKSFTALAAALLDYEKKIMLDSPVTSYFKDIRFNADIGRDVTIRSLLTHTSGLDNNPLVYRMAYSGEINEKDMLRILGEATTVRAKPGKYEYDNLGYNIYGLAVQEYLHKKWQDLLQEKIFAPLGMKRTTAYISVAKKNNWTIALPYSGTVPGGLQKLYLEKQDNTMQSAGGLITTASDIALWLQAQINDGKIKNKQIFPAQVINASHSGYASFEKGSGIFASSGKYGLGWSTGQYNNERIIYHFGGFPGFRSHISFMPDKKIGLAIFVNELNIGGLASDMLAGLVYDWVVGAEVIDKYSKKIDEIESMYKKAMEGVERGFADRAKRTWQISMPLLTYTGKYQHPLYGEIDISIENNVLTVRRGNLYARSTPFTEKESIRIELIPGSGQVIYFKLDDTGKVNGFTLEKLEYKRVN